MRIGVLVARGGVSEERSTGMGGCMAVSVLEFGGGIDKSITIFSGGMEGIMEVLWSKRWRRASNADAAERKERPE